MRADLALIHHDIKTQHRIGVNQGVRPDTVFDKAVGLTFDSKHSIHS